MTTKTFCDICNSVTPKQLTLNLYTKSLEIEELDLCESCFNQIVKLLDLFKKWKKVVTPSYLTMKMTAKAGKKA